MQQGGIPTPLDRIQAVRFAYFAVRNLLESIAMNVNGGYFIGSENGSVIMQEWKKLKKYADPWKRFNGKRWWSSYADVIRRLAVNPEVRRKLEK